jgi:hypothetical protein
VGYGLKVRVTSARAGYNSVSTYSAVTDVVQPGLLGVTPRLSDTTPTVGQVLSITEKTSIDKWGPQPVTGSYQWLRNGKTVIGIEPTYTVQPADAGARLSVRVTGVANDYASVVKVSSSSSKVAKASFAGKGAPTISVAGTVLTVDEGNWSPAPDSFVYQWYRNGNPISKASGRSYDHSAATGDFRVKVKAVRAGYNTAHAYSATTKL